VPYAIEFKPSSEAARADEGLVDFWKVEKKPVLVERVAPEYPEEAQWENLEGEVLVRFQVGKDGRVEQVEVLEGEKVFRQAAIDAVRQFVFEPATHDFRPVRVRVIESIKFKIPD
jgi:protein TonB